MKKSIFIIASLLLVTGISMTGCQTPEEKLDESHVEVEKAQENLEEANQEYINQYNEFKLEVNKEITANEKLIADLKEGAKTQKKEAKIEYEKTIADLELRNQAMKDQINDHEVENKEKWESFKEEFKHDMNELGQSIKDLGKNNVK